MSFPRMIRNVLKPDKKEFFIASSAEQGRASLAVRKLGKHEFLKGFTQSLGSSKSSLQRNEKQQYHFHHGWFSPWQLESKRSNIPLVQHP